MAKVADMTDVTDRMLAEAAEWYAKHSVPAPFREVDVRVVRKALRLAGGNWHRMVIESPTAITVYHSPRW